VPNNEIQMLRLGLDEDEKRSYTKNKISLNKKIGRVFSAARKNAKRSSCYICGAPCTSFCRSHSVPKFCLKRIAIDGKVFFSGIQADLPFFGTDSGVNEAGTFQLICRDCDNTLFQDYAPGS